MVALAAISGCTTLSGDVAFDGAEPDQAMVIVVADGMRTGLMTSELYSFSFQRVDLASSTVLQDKFAIGFEGYGAIASRELKKPEELQTSVRFGAVRAPAGDFALIFRLDQAGALRNLNCYALGAAVFRIEPGKLNIVALGNVRAPTTVYPNVVEKQVKAVLAGYPKLSAPLTVARRLGALRFETRPGSMKSCEPESRFSLLP